MLLEIILSKEVVAPVLIIAFSILIYGVISRIVKKLFRIKSKRINEKRQKTFVGLVNNVIKYFILIIALMMILEVYGIDTKSLVASLGVVSLVAGLALQDLLKDIIGGFSILLEDQYSVGDVVTISGFTGTVVALGLKTTKIKAYTGEIKMIANRNISEVVNHSMEENNALIDISIGYEEDVHKVSEFLTELCQTLTEELKLPHPAECLGVEELADSSVVFRLAIPSMYADKFRIARKVRERIKEECDKNHIVIAYPQVVVHHG